MAHLILHKKDLIHNINQIKTICNQYNLGLMNVIKVAEKNKPICQLFRDLSSGSFGVSHPIVSKNSKEKTILLTLPTHQNIKKVLLNCQASVHSEVRTLEIFSKRVTQSRISHDIILMLDIGDKREGVSLENALSFIGQIMPLQSPYLRFKGVATNFACCHGVLPSIENISRFCNIVEKIQKTYSLIFENISVGGSVILPWLEHNPLPKPINQIRIGEAFFLGSIPGSTTQYKDLRNTCFFEGTIVEIKTKNIQPLNTGTKNAFGDAAIVKYVGMRKRALLNFGMSHINSYHLESEDKEMECVNVNSHYTIFDITNSKQTYTVGSKIRFSMRYPALMQGMLSPLVKKKVI